MKNKKNIIDYIAIILFICSFDSAYTQDKCGCMKNIEKGEITIPYAKDGVTIQFFYSAIGSFSYGDSDFAPPTYLSQAGYSNWIDFTSDFPSSANNTVLLKFDWKKLPSWNFIQNEDGKTYIGLFLDAKRNHDVEKIKIVNIRTSCFHPSCSPEKLIFTIMVYLADK